MHRKGAGKPAAAVAALVAVVAGTTGPVRAEAAGSGPADVPSTKLHLPKVVNTPGTWSGDEGPDGPLAALGLALRTSPEGLSGQRQHLQLFGVSAVDGRARWIRLPGVKLEDEALVGWFALSPDGRWIGWSRHQEGVNAGVTGRLVGWAVMDTTTRKVRRLADATHPLLRETASDLAFSGDSRYLLTSYETPHAPRTRGHRFVAWDVKDGSPRVLEKPGHYWLPGVGSAPSGVVWSRGRTVYREAATGDRGSYSLPKSVVTASWAPNGKAFAYIGRPIGRPAGRWRLYAGRSLADARDHVLPLGVQPGQLLGWRDNRHVVVGHFRRTVHVVDVVTGDAVELDLAGQGEPLNPPLLAADLWRNPLGAPVEPDGTSDPRKPFRWGGGAVAALAGALVLRRKRRSA
jgi:WD40-like Beta Propeller Repeat